jgi:hypothetical protein
MVDGKSVLLHVKQLTLDSGSHKLNRKGMEWVALLLEIVRVVKESVV